MAAISSSSVGPCFGSVFGSRSWTSDHDQFQGLMRVGVDQRQGLGEPVLRFIPPRSLRVLGVGAVPCPPPVRLEVVAEPCERTNEVVAGQLGFGSRRKAILEACARKWLGRLAAGADRLRQPGPGRDHLRWCLSRPPAGFGLCPRSPSMSLIEYRERADIDFRRVINDHRIGAVVGPWLAPAVHQGDVASWPGEGAECRFGRGCGVVVCARCCGWRAGLRL